MDKKLEIGDLTIEIDNVGVSFDLGPHTELTYTVLERDDIIELVGFLAQYLGATQ